MHPVLLDLYGFHLHSFGVMVALAFLVGLGWSILRAHRREFSKDLVIEAVFWIIISAMVGARLFYILFFPDLFFQNPLGVLLGQGGLVWYGGVIGATGVLLWWTRRNQVSLWTLTDIIIPPVALGLALGRIGCLLAGCCYGGYCTLPWAIHYPLDHPTHGLGVHPSPLYESGLMVLTAWALAWFSSRQKAAGQTTWAFFIVYGIIRFILEYYRGDRLVWFEPLNLSASQLISLLSILVGVGFFGWVTQKKAIDQSSDVGTESSVPSSIG